MSAPIEDGLRIQNDGSFTSGKMVCAMMLVPINLLRQETCNTGWMLEGGSSNL